MCDMWKFVAIDAVDNVVLEKDENNICATSYMLWREYFGVSANLTRFRYLLDDVFCYSVAMECGLLTGRQTSGNNLTGKSNKFMLKARQDE